MARIQSRLRPIYQSRWSVRLGARYVWFLGLLIAFSGCSQGDAPDSTENLTHVAPLVSLTDVTVEAGLGDFTHVTGAAGDTWFPETMGSGGGFIDYNGDDWLDVLLVGGGSWSEDEKVPAVQLYRNEGGGAFSRVTEETGLAEVHTYGFGVSVADFDNDRDQDFYLTTLYENMLFRNDDGVFTEIGREAGIANKSEWSSGSLFFDADNDGWLDIYVGNYVEWSPDNDLFCTVDGVIKSYCTPELYEGITGRYYHNNGDGTYTDRTDEAGFGNSPGMTLAVAELDFNTDGWSDLVVANDTQRDLLYENQHDGTFKEKGVISGIAFDENGRTRAGMGLDVGDVDNTGQESIFVASFSKEMIGIFRHIGSGLFVDRAAISRVGQSSILTLTFGLFLFDIELDGDLDLLLANGHITEEIEHLEDGITYRQPVQLFLNEGDGHFDEVKEHTGDALDQRLVARGTWYGDYDRDGDLDVLISENGGPVHLWRNDLQHGRFLRVQLDGYQSNFDGIGAQIVAYVGNQRMSRRIRTGSSYLSQSEKIATFGLGDASFVDSLVVFWPSGKVDRFTSLDADQEVRISENTGTFERKPLSLSHTITRD